ncbi:zinc ribbon domain-containing protein [bacterium]|nr:zinc ribbon domain-containing protein [candidate division CSSED10-310 bacterium]
MPIYEYKCRNCGNRFELMQTFSAGKTATCPKCGQEGHRTISLTGFILKGSGWYVTDHPSKDRKRGLAAEGTDTGTGDGSGTNTGGADGAAVKTTAKTATDSGSST